MAVYEYQLQLQNKQIRSKKENLCHEFISKTRQTYKHYVHNYYFLIRMYSFQKNEVKLFMKDILAIYAKKVFKGKKTYS